jgi:SAM-dependent methyltransferase
MTKKSKIKDLANVEQSPIKLDLGCGNNKEDGWVGVDNIKTEKTDVVHDLETYPWPFKDESVDEVKISHYIEHVKDLIPFMNELHRVMKKGAKCSIAAPYYTSIRCWQDPTHVQAISEATFMYYNKAWREANKLDHYAITTDFDFQYGYSLDPVWSNRSDEAKQFAIKHYWNVVSDIFVTLFKR